MKRYLVVANQTLGGQHLLEAIKRLHAEQPASFTVVVPATRTAGLYSTVLAAYAGEPSTADTDEANAQASARLAQLLAMLHAAGVDASGAIGDEDPIAAVEDALRSQTFDEVVLSTLPPGASRWLSMDLVHKLERAVDIPVIHVYGKARQYPTHIEQQANEDVAE